MQPGCLEGGMRPEAANNMKIGGTACCEHCILWLCNQDLAHMLYMLSILSLHKHVAEMSNIWVLMAKADGKT